MNDKSGWLPPGARPSSRKHTGITDKNVEQKVTKMESASVMRAKENKMVFDSGSIACPKCGGDQISANKKGFGVGKALLGGIVAGFIGSRKVQITCLKCGHAWTAGKRK